MRVPYVGTKHHTEFLQKKIWFVSKTILISPHVYSGKYSTNNSVYKYRLFVTNNLEESFFILQYN
jgi:hypothetical protein